MKIIASNFKTNHTRKTTNEFILNVNSFLKDENIQNDVYIFPTATSFDDFDIEKNYSFNSVIKSDFLSFSIIKTEYFDLRNMLRRAKHRQISHYSQARFRT